MDGPSEELRAHVAEELSSLPPGELRGQGEEELAAALLQRLVEVAGADVNSDLDAILRLQRLDVNEPIELGTFAQAEVLLMAVNQWASLFSYVSAAVYGPASPMPKRLAGWGAKAIIHIQRAVTVLMMPLSAAAKVTGASSWSISVGFPWGISVGLSWP